jgi:hypothetical protein
LLDQPPDVPPFLNRRLRHAEYGMPVLHHRCRVANNKHSGRVYEFQEWINERPPGTVGLGTEHLWNRRCCDPAVHSTVALGILLPPAITPLSSTVSTLTSVTTLTPSFSRRLWTDTRWPPPPSEHGWGGAIYFGFHQRNRVTEPSI